MKKEKKTIKEKVKKEKITLEKLASLIEKLAIFTVNGFEEIKQELSSVKGELSSVKGELSSVKGELSSVKDEQSSLKEDSKDTNRCVISIERKLSGTLESLDETVHRSEFEKLARRVEVLEA